MKGILTYHSIDDTGSVISIDPATFRRHVEWLASGTVKVVPLAAIATLPPDDDAVAITFDDGFANFGEVAAPLLAGHGLPATVFVVSDAVGGTNAWRGIGDAGIPTLPLLGWDALGRLAAQGFEIGAHTRTHADLARAGAAAIEDEVAGSQATIAARLGAAPRAFAYPYGHVGASAEVVGRHFAWGCTTELRTVGPHDRPALLPRLDSYYFRDARRLARWGSTRLRCFIQLRASARGFRQRLSTMGDR